VEGLTADQRLITDTKIARRPGMFGKVIGNLGSYSIPALEFKSKSRGAVATLLGVPIDSGILPLPPRLLEPKIEKKVVSR